MRGRRMEREGRGWKEEEEEQVEEVLASVAF